MWSSQESWSLKKKISDMEEQLKVMCNHFLLLFLLQTTSCDKRVESLSIYSTRRPVQTAWSLCETPCCALSCLSAAADTFCHHYAVLCADCVNPLAHRATMLQCWLTALCCALFKRIQTRTLLFSVSSRSKGATGLKMASETQSCVILNEWLCFIINHSGLFRSGHRAPCFNETNYSKCIV